MKWFLALVKKYTEVQKLTAEIIRESAEKIYVYQAEKIDGHRVQNPELHRRAAGHRLRSIRKRHSRS